MAVQNGSGILDGFRNPALSRVNGIITGHCIICGQYIGNEYDSNYYSLIKRKYCQTHAKEYKDLKMIFIRRDYKARKKKTVKVMNDLCDQFRKEVSVQREIIAELQRELDDMKRLK